MFGWPKRRRIHAPGTAVPVTPPDPAPELTCSGGFGLGADWRAEQAEKQKAYEERRAEVRHANGIPHKAGRSIKTGVDR